jgi:PAS domain S-box-containing protein
VLVEVSPELPPVLRGGYCGKWRASRHIPCGKGIDVEPEVDGTACDSETLHPIQLRLQIALEASNAGTWDYDLRRDRLEWSRELAQMAGAPPIGLSGSLAECLECVHPEDRPRLERALRDALERDSKLRVEARVRFRRSGSERWLLVQGQTRRDESGRPLGITGVAMDITNRKEAEAVHHRLAQSERLRALGEMASGIAHDLNQSLALITGYSDMARQELSVDAPDLARVREMVGITAQAAIEGGQVLRGLLSFVRTQELLVEEERVDLGQVLQDVARLTAPRWRDAAQAEGRPIDLIVDAQPNSAIDGSLPALREAITNLIFNAVDALPHGGVIKLGARHEDDNVAVEVSDSGTGMPADVQARVFDPFFTTKGERGTGLGLPQVLTVVERHGGTIELDSRPGRGTTFRLKFPRAIDGRRRPATLPRVPVAEPDQRIRILVVEDEQQLARMAGLVLRQRGHDVVLAASVEEALVYLNQAPFDLVISDLGLGPGQNGWDLAGAVRERWPTTRFVLVTGWGAAIDPAEARARGVDQVIAKPYRIADLRQIADDVAGASGNE